MNQAPSSIFMVRPEHFAYNPETAASNTFQRDLLMCDSHKITQEALKEFERFVDQLRSAGIDVHVFGSPKEHHAPDAVFPNNWISFHEDGHVLLYPMLTRNRNIERREELIDILSEHFYVKEIIDMSDEENTGRILEGTGSVIFDRINKVAYANESPRTHKNLFYDVCQLLGYKGIFFKATNEYGVDIYHTNVLMTVGDGFAVICTEAIDIADKALVINSLKSGGLEVIEISYHQMNCFAGNMLELQNGAKEHFLVMSNTAYHSLRDDQKNKLSKYVSIIHPDISTIESIGGGSARCMIAGIHLQKK